ncbi:MAG: hypothetical protein KKD44_14925 [Proteobacteria bacterium]|nr:hypothetical protein [Pseudomonadota bacterium]
MRIMNSKSMSITIAVLICLVLGGLFIFYSLRPDMTQEFLVLVPVEFSGLSGDLIISSESTRAIEVKVKGPKEKLEHLTSLTCRLSLSGVQVGEKHIPVTPSLFLLPQNVMIQSIQPVSIHVSIDKKISRELPVEIVYTGSPASGYRIGGVLAYPKSVTVAGPRLLIESLDKIRTKAVDITGIIESCKKEAVFDIDPSLPLILPPGPVVATISITEKRVVKKMDLPVFLPQNSVEVNPTLASIEISGPENRFNGMDVLKDIQISIKVDDLMPGIYVRRATISLPVDFTLISVTPELFTLTIK